jgi:hypothetical protein
MMPLIPERAPAGTQGVLETQKNPPKWSQRDVRPKCARLSEIHYPVQLVSPMPKSGHFALVRADSCSIFVQEILCLTALPAVSQELLKKASKPIANSKAGH